MRFLCLLLLLLGIIHPSFAMPVRIKDLTNVDGVRGNDLVGYGLVVGLNGSGDSLRNAPFTEEIMAGLLEVVSRMWWKLPSSELRACNDGSSQAARSRDIGSRGWDRVSQPSTFRIWI